MDNENGNFCLLNSFPRLPVDGYYRYRTNPNPDTVPWVITGAMRVKRILTDTETDEICRANGVEPMARQGGPINLENFGLSAGETIRFSQRDEKNFRNSQNAKGEFTADVLIDLADSDSDWWTGRYNRAILGMSKSDDTEFRQFYQEILKRTKDMDDYSESDQEILTDSFTVKDGKGKEYIYRVELDGYLHGVVLSKTDKKKFDAAARKEKTGGKNGQSASNFDRRIRNARSGLGGYHNGSSRNIRPDGNSGYGRMGSESPESNKTGNDSRRESAYQEVSDTAEVSSKKSDRDTESVSNRSLLANAFDTIITNPVEKQKLEEYRQSIQMMNEQEEKLRELRGQIKEMSFSKGPRDKEKLKALQLEATKTANRISTLDGILLRFEASAPLQRVLDREKQKAAKRQKERDDAVRKEYREKTLETQAKRDARAKLQKLVLDTAKWVSYPGKQDVKCPDFLKKPYGDFLNSIDMSSKRLTAGGDPTMNDLRMTNAMSTLATVLDRVVKSQDPSQNGVDVPDVPYLDLPAKFVDEIQEITEALKVLRLIG